MENTDAIPNPCNNKRKLYSCYLTQMVTMLYFVA